MMKLEISRKSLDKLVRKLEAASRERVFFEALNSTALHMRHWILTERLSGPRPLYLGRVTSVLASSISIVPAHREGETIVAKIGTNVKYARIHEYGGWIAPKNKPFLAWKSRETGKWIYTTKPVYIPPRPFMKPAIKDTRNRGIVIDELKKAIHNALQTP